MKKKPAKRNYKLEYERDNSSTKRKKYRAALTRYRRKNKKGSAGKDAIHKNGKIVGYGSRKANRADGARKATRARMRNKRK